MFRQNFRTRLIIGTALWIIVGQCISGFLLASILAASSYPNSTTT